MSNPYQSPNEPEACLSGDTSSEATAADELSSEAQGNLRLTSKIVRIAAIAAGLASLSGILQVWATFQFYGLPNGWTLWHVFICFRIVYTPCWLLLAWMMWKYARFLDRMVDRGIGELEGVIEQQAKMWLAVGLLVFTILVGLTLMVVFGVAANPPP